MCLLSNATRYASPGPGSFTCYQKVTWLYISACLPLLRLPIQFSPTARIGEVPRQRLLFPEQFEINKAQCQWLENHAELLPCGFVLEPFGETTAVLKEIPLPLAGGGAHTELIQQMIREEVDSREDLLRMIADYSSRGEWTTSSRNKLERAFQQGEIPALANPWGTLFEKMSIDKLNAMFSKGRT